MKTKQTILGGGTIYVKRRELSSYGIINYKYKACHHDKPFLFIYFSKSLKTLNLKF
jgi:hypothetical protein